MISGDAWDAALTLSVRADDGVAPLKLSLGAAHAATAAEARRFARSHGLASGWIFANSPTSVTCLHELSVFPLAFSILGAPPADGRATWLESHRRAQCLLPRGCPSVAGRLPAETSTLDEVRLVMEHEIPHGGAPA